MTKGDAVNCHGGMAQNEALLPPNEQYAAKQKIFRRVCLKKKRANN